MIKTVDFHKYVRVIKRHLPAVLLFFFFSWVFMGQSLTNCSNTVIGNSPGGDHLNGIISLLSNGNRPYGGFSSNSNFPFGESISQPQLATSALLMVPVWLLSMLVGSVCSWNLMVFAGYMLSAISMYGFIFWLLRHRGVAVFAAIAVAFTPYHYFKTWGHLSYIHSEIFVLILWSFLALWKKPTVLKSLVFGGLTAMLFYSDGYYPMIGGVLVASLVMYSLLSLLHSTNYNFRNFIKDKRITSLVVSFVTTAILILPIFAVTFVYSNRIQGNLSSVRGNILDEVANYGTRPMDFLLPSVTHPIDPVSDIVQDYRADKDYSNTGEYHLFLGFSVISLFVFSVIYQWRHRNQQTKQSKWLYFVTKVSFVVMLVGILVSAIPEFKLGGITFILPSRIIAGLTEFWRVYSRLYLIINVAVVTVASVGLYLWLKTIQSSKKKAVLLVLVSAFLVLEMLPVNPIARTDQLSLNEFNETYHTLAKDGSISSVAAYPLYDPPYHPTYFTDQLVHKKPLLNSYNSNDSEMLLHRALSGINDGQTLGALKSLGVNELLLYRIPTAADIRTYALYGSYPARVVRIDQKVEKKEYAIVPDVNFSQPTVNRGTQISCRQPISAIATMNIRRLAGSEHRSSARIRYELKGRPGQTAIVSINGKRVADVVFTSKNQIVQIESLIDPSTALIQQYSLSTNPKVGFPEVCNLDISL